MKTIKLLLILSFVSVMTTNIQAQTKSSYSEEEIVSVIKKCTNALENSRTNASIPSANYHYWCKNSIDGTVVLEGKADYILNNKTGKSNIAHTMVHLYYWNDEKPFYVKNISYLSVNKEPLRCIVLKGEEGKSRRTIGYPTMRQHIIIDTNVCAYWEAYNWIFFDKKYISSTTMTDATDNEGNSCYLVCMTVDHTKIGGTHEVQFYIDKTSGLMHKVVISTQNTKPDNYRSIGATSANPLKSYTIEEEIAELYYRIEDGKMVMDKMHYTIKDSGIAHQKSPCGKNTKHHMMREEEYQRY